MEINVNVIEKEFSFFHIEKPNSLKKSQNCFDYSNFIDKYLLFDDSVSHTFNEN